MSSSADVEYPFPVEFLSSLRLADVIDELIDPSRLVDISEKESVDSAISTMYRNGVSSLVMYKMAEDGKREYYAFLTIADIVGFLVFQKDFEQSEHSQLKDTQALKTPIVNVCGNVAESMKFIMMPTTTNLVQAIRTMRKGFHHVLVYHPSDEKCLSSTNATFIKETQSAKGPTVVGQSDLVEFLCKRSKSLGSILNSSAESLMQLSIKYSESPDPNQPAHLPGSRWTGGKMKYALHQPEHYTAFNCFKSMVLHRVSAVAIVDDGGKLVETLSISDFSAISESNASNLFKPVIQFLQECLEARRPPVTLLKSNTMIEILNAMTENQIHRVWIVEQSSSKPIGSVTMSDILAGMIPSEESLEE